MKKAEAHTSCLLVVVVVVVVVLGIGGRYQDEAMIQYGICKILIETIVTSFFLYIPMFQAREAYHQHQLKQKQCSGRVARNIINDTAGLLGTTRRGKTRRSMTVSDPMRKINVQRSNNNFHDRKESTNDETNKKRAREDIHRENKLQYYGILQSPLPSPYNLF